MSAGVKQAETHLVVSPEEFDAIRRRMFDALIGRGLSRQDAEDAVHHVLEAIVRRPDAFGVGLASIDEPGAWFIKAALAAYAGRPRSERSRRSGEKPNDHRVLGHGSRAIPRLPRPEFIEILDLVATAPLTARQRRYLRAVLVDHSSIAEIAASTGTPPNSVRAVLRQATTILRQRRLPAVA